MSAFVYFLSITAFRTFFSQVLDNSRVGKTALSASFAIVFSSGVTTVISTSPVIGETISTGVVGLDCPILRIICLMSSLVAVELAKLLLITTIISCQISAPVKLLNVNMAGIPGTILLSNGGK